MVVFALGAILLAATAALVAFLLRLSWPGTVLAAYLVGVAEIVLLSEALSTVHAVGRYGYLAGEAVAFGGALALWLRAARPRPRAPRVSLGHPVVAALALLVAAAVVYQAFVVVATPPNTWDAMTYHLARAAAWLQRGAVEWHPSPTARANAFPPNAEIQVLWTLALAGRDTFAALPQLVAELATMTAIFGTARRIGHDRAASAFAALLFATLAEVALQATSTQNDLVATAPVAAAAYFLLGRTRKEVALAAAAIGLALGTKLTVLFALPFLALLALAVLPRRRVAELAAATAVAFAAVGAWGYVASLEHTGSLVGAGRETAASTPRRTLRGTVSTSARILWRFADLSGWNAPSNVSDNVRTVGEHVFADAHVRLNPRESTQTPFGLAPNTAAHEDFSFFGPLGMLVVLPLCAGFLVAGALRRTSRERFLLALSLPLFVVGVSLAYRYNMWIGRFMVLPVALTMPLAAWLYSWRLASTLAVALACVFLPLAEVRNQLHPAPDAWRMSRVDAQTIIWPRLRPVIHAVDARVPADARLGYVLGSDDWSYPLYGPTLERRLEQLPRRRTLAVARRRGLSWVVVAHRVRGGDGYVATRLGHWTLLRYDASRLASSSRRRMNGFASLTISSR